MCHFCKTSIKQLKILLTQHLVWFSKRQFFFPSQHQPPVFPTLSHINPGHIPPSGILRIHFRRFQKQSAKKRRLPPSRPSVGPHETAWLRPEVFRWNFVCPTHSAGSHSGLHWTKITDILFLRSYRAYWLINCLLYTKICTNKQCKN
jgi:hypothetical protein